MSALALSAEQFAQCLMPFAPLASPIALAVSGGPDSMALAFCMHRAGYDCIAFIIDHGLRSESAQEAVQTKTTLEKMGVRTEILRWQHDTITNALHEQARAARYDLLLQACHKQKSNALLTAHHRDDQAETILMRLAKGSAVEGLAGITPQSMRGDIRLLRPFLNVAKETLVTTCQVNNIPFITDPSNASDQFTRGRLRKIMPLLAQEGLTTESLLRLGTRAAEAAQALTTITHEFLRDAAQTEKGGSVRINRLALPKTPRAIGLRAIAHCLRYIHANAYPPEQDGLGDIYDIILSAQTNTTRSFYGCLISVTGTHVNFFREPAAASESTPLQAGQIILWDGRWIITSDATTLNGEIRALGTPPHEIIDLLSPSLRPNIPQGRIRASLPALWQQERLVAIPSFTEKIGFHAILSKQAFP